MARQALTLAGTVIGAAFGVPQLGFAIGSLVGNMVDPVQIQGPKIGDMAVQTSRDGVPRPIVFGTAAVMGNIIDRGEPRIVKKKEKQGKGGPETVTEHVYMTFAIRVCEGPVTSISRVWENEKLVYDVTPGSTISGDAADWLSKVNFYYGGETQLPDPALEVIHGVGSTPAYRGTCYAVWDKKDLTEFGGAIPQYRFEVNGGDFGFDTYAAYVINLLHFDGANGSQTYTDETGRAWTGTTPEQIVTDQQKFGTGSLLLDGDVFSPTYVNCVDTYYTTPSIGTQDFCAEIFAWVDPAYTTISNRTLFGFDSSVYKFAVNHDIFHGGANGKFSGVIGSGAKELFALATPTLSQWYHLALVRDGNTLAFYVDGDQQGSVNVSGVDIAAETSLYIGYRPSQGLSYYPFHGRLDEFRLTVGVPRYTGNFTPPAQAFTYP